MGRSWVDGVTWPADVWVVSPGNSLRPKLLGLQPGMLSRVCKVSGRSVV
jgi:hypothetical protein